MTSRTIARIYKREEHAPLALFAACSSARCVRCNISSAHYRLLLLGIFRIFPASSARHHLPGVFGSASSGSSLGRSWPGLFRLSTTARRMTDNTVTVNVGALSNAIAVAIQQAATGTAQATANVTPVPSQTCAGFSGASQQLSDQRPP